MTIFTIKFGKFANFTVRFQKHYTHKSTIFKSLSLQLQVSGPTGINFRYSYSFVGLTGYVFTVTVRYRYIKNGLQNYFPKISVTVVIS